MRCGSANALLAENSVRPPLQLPFCAWCRDKRNLQVSETPHHALWACPHHEEDTRPQVRDTQHHREKAEVGAEKCPAFWLRGILPQAAVDAAFGGDGAWDPYPFLTMKVDPRKEKEPGSRAAPEDPLCTAPEEQLPPLKLAPGAIAATDGSGGRFPTDRLRRRIGFGAVIAYPVQKLGDRDDLDTFQVVARWEGGTGGPQTVPRAELAAVVEVLDQTEGDILILSDSAYVVGHCKNKFGASAVSNRDLWARARSRLMGRAGKVTVEKVPAHTSPDAVDRGEVRRVDQWLNGIADDLATAGARTAALPPAVASEIEDLRTFLRAVQDRLLVICSDAFASRTSEEDRKAARAEVLRDPAPPRPPLRTRLAAAAQASTHHVFLNRWEQRVVCSGCLRRSRPELALRWLSKPCPAIDRPRPGGGIHPSHRLFAAGHRPRLVACHRCACYAVQKTQRLRYQCRGILSGGKHRLKRLRQGLLPQGKGGLGAPHAGCTPLASQPSPAAGQRRPDPPLSAAERLEAVRRRVRARTTAAVAK